MFASSRSGMFSRIFCAPDQYPLRSFPRQSSCAQDGNSGLGGIHFALLVAIGFDEQFIRGRTKTRTQTRTSGPFLAWVGFSRLKHACTRPDKLPGDKRGQASPIPTLASKFTSLLFSTVCRGFFPRLRPKSYRILYQRRKPDVSGSFRLYPFLSGSHLQTSPGYDR